MSGFILRCPYYTTCEDFKQLRAYKNGRFVYDDSHTVSHPRAELLIPPSGFSGDPPLGGGIP